MDELAQERGGEHRAEDEGVGTHIPGDPTHCPISCSQGHVQEQNHLNTIHSHAPKGSSISLCASTWK